MKSLFPKYFGALLGMMTYLALIFSPLALRLNTFLHGYFEHLKLVGENATTLPAWLLVVAGVASILISCFVFQSRIPFWHKVSLFSFSFILTLLWPPALVVWNIVWTPVILLVSIIWSLICSHMIKKFLPAEKITPHQDAVDFYTMDTDI